MKHELSDRVAWCFSATAGVSFVAWYIYAVAVLGLPFHPWCSVAAAVALMITFFFWSATSPATARIVRRTMGLWDISVFLAVLLAALFGGAGRPFPAFALVMVLIASSVLGAAIVIFGARNWLRHIAAQFRSLTVQQLNPADLGAAGDDPSPRGGNSGFNEDDPRRRNGMAVSSTAHSPASMLDWPEP